MRNFKLIYYKLIQLIFLKNNYSQLLKIRVQKNKNIFLNLIVFFCFFFLNFFFFNFKNLKHRKDLHSKYNKLKKILKKSLKILFTIFL